jgi:hypothetical protein
VLTLKLAPDIPSLESLGASAPDDFFADPPRVVTADRATNVGSAIRLPLPGTPDEHGRQHETPRGAGTGYLQLCRFPAGGLEGWRARLTQPRSSSLAARQWNLICHLRAHGLAAPDLVALGERNSGAIASESFLITRELEGFVPLAEWLAQTRDRATRRRGLRSLALALAQLFHSGAWLPRTSFAGLMIQTRDGDDCAAIQLVNLASEQDVLRERGLVRARLPAIAFTQFARGRIVPTISARRRKELLAALAREAGSLVSPRERRELLVALRIRGADARELSKRCE